MAPDAAVAPTRTPLRKAAVRAEVGPRIEAIGQEAQAEPDSVVGRPTGGQVPADPFASLRGVAGWALDYVAFLREPIDRLEGDPGSVRATADAIGAAARRLRELAEAQRETLAKPEGWTGVARDAYQASMEALGEELSAVADAVAVKGVVVESTGAMVQALREAVLHTVGQYSDSLVPGAIHAYVFAPVTFGASIAMFLGSVVDSATQLGTTIAGKMDDLTAALTRQVDRMRQLDEIADDIGRRWDRFEAAAGGEATATMARTVARPSAGERETEASRPMTRATVTAEHAVMRPMANSVVAAEPEHALLRPMESHRVAAEPDHEALRPMVSGTVAAEHTAMRPMEARRLVVADEAEPLQPMEARRAFAVEHQVAEPVLRATRETAVRRVTE
ncbi:hypothetical protein LZG04_38525 [Saccharothrix sp. S26]|uniref:hypothetical protein n=1 Tax=Saccharothrix sp. S26 TaxID=2907215 RepID=UPI001F2B6965|nr:hypothetical protein [Saccharothrix sp. S26]MCE7000672.1 hypothetical protein [Saccharothrix sp. S26]